MGRGDDLRTKSGDLDFRNVTVKQLVTVILGILKAAVTNHVKPGDLWSVQAASLNMPSLIRAVASGMQNISEVDLGDELNTLVPEIVLALTTAKHDHKIVIYQRPSGDVRKEMRRIMFNHTLAPTARQLRTDGWEVERGIPFRTLEDNSRITEELAAWIVQYFDQHEQVCEDDVVGYLRERYHFDPEDSTPQGRTRLLNTMAKVGLVAAAGKSEGRLTLSDGCLKGYEDAIVSVVQEVLPILPSTENVVKSNTGIPAPLRDILRINFEFAEMYLTLDPDNDSEDRRVKIVHGDYEFALSGEDVPEFQKSFRGGKDFWLVVVDQFGNKLTIKCSTGFHLLRG